MNEVHLKIYGRVQGVFFRDSAQKQAQFLGLSGWAKNMPDGTVEILAQGDEKNLKRLINWCHEGPRLAQVDRIEEKWREPEKSFSGFDVQYH